MAGLEADTDSIPRIKLGEIGYTGLHISNGQILEEAKRELRFPECVRTYKNMAMDTTLSSAISLYEMMVGKVDWKCVPPDDATPTEKQRAEFINSCMGDMEHTWFDFISEVTSCFTYGFSVHEKVYRRRMRRFGSKYNDGLVGLRKLPIRSQDTIEKWLYADNARDLIGVEQSLEGVIDYYRIDAKGRTTVEIPREKFLLFRCNTKKDNPEGTSPLKSCYTSWKWRTLLEEHEAIGVSREMRGVPVVSIPPRYMSEDASDSEKAIYEYYKQMVRNLHLNEQTGIVMPLAYDPESRQPLFKFELLSVTGTKGYDVSQIITRYDNKMLMAFFADLLRLGQEKVGSFSLAGAKTSILAMAIEYRLREIKSVLDKDLIPSLFAMNGWTDERLPTFSYSDLDESDLDDFSKAIQRIFSVNAVEFDRPVANIIRERLGVKGKPEEQEVDEDALPNNRSRSGDGMKTAGEGTSTSVGGPDPSASNMEN